MTLRQLRQIASDLGVSLYSRKSKEELLNEIHSVKGEGEFTSSEPSAAPGSSSPSLERLEAGFSPAPRPEAETKVVFLPRDPQWAYVFWEIAEAERTRAIEAGAGQLCLRVADVTGLPSGAAHPHTLQEVPVDSHATEWYLPVPLSDRDYRVELGYRKHGGGWLSMGFSAVARVPALHPSEQILDQFVPFSLEAAPSDMTVATAYPHSNPNPTGADSGLHERLYQTATVRWKHFGRGSEAFHELEDSDSAAGRRSLHDSGIGLWASGRNDSGIGGVAPRQRSFWLVADAELIVYGATDPAAKLTIGDEEVPLSPDGTFRVQVPFRDGQQLYPIQAVAADGEQKRSITLKFERTTPEDNSNPSSQAVAEWF
ncbi:DUF4912 domain-containing protein [Synechococcus sp. BA-124 BA4]|uniref:DUF4912 domain-containing protein n=1 Tax=unclassified Synechococcus TaxID=2626047 RepID=UPI0018CF1E9F|nr:MULTISPECIES: DUF4912 domain-containing protein [unclassified Synechococcus]MEA5399172.1 DUF4912 domain-containing protein [Synechococcus sp. BA-124 BA4]QPN57462.1 DUF4912 domain-containing protein [Synechococcus sp. CBW1107]CAK6701363.1 hypothetical protein BBFGKLBO_03091 [Synechococcus sp. CBW1107]